MFSFWPQSTMRGVRMQAEQSMVGKVLSSLAMTPPMVVCFSTMVTLSPASARSRAAWMPATPPPMTRTSLLISTSFEKRGSSRRALATDILRMSQAFSVATGMSVWIQEQCSRMLPISNR